MKYWEKFYQCDCSGEGILVSYEYEDDGLEYIDLAYWSEGVSCNHTMTFKQRMRWCWQIMIKGKVWNDMVMLNKETAGEIGKTLLTWSMTKKGDKK